MKNSNSNTLFNNFRWTCLLSKSKRFYLAIIIFFLYIVILFVFGRLFSIDVITLSFIPILIWAYYAGRLGGIISGIVIIPFFIGFSKLFGWQSYYLEFSELPFITYLVYAFWGFILGDLQETRQRLELELDKQVNTEHELLGKELQFRSLFEHGNDAVFILDLNYFTITVNQRAYDWLGYTPPELIKMHASKLVIRDEWGSELSNLASLAAGRVLPVYERTFVRKDGSSITGEVNIALIKNQDGTPTHYQSVVRDITERSRTQEQLRLQAAVLEAAASGIFITDIDGSIVWSNPAFTKLSGYPAAEIIGKNPRFLKSNVQDKHFYTNLWDTIISGKVWRGRIVNKRKDGDLYDAELVITPVISDYGKIEQFVAITQDISAQVKAEKQLEHLALHDSLTDLPNRVLFYERFEQLSAIAVRQDQKCAILFIDIDNFKLVNDRFGHEKGDLLLKSIAGRLSRMMRSSDTVARLGGDEFGISLANVTREGVRVVATKILDTLKQEFTMNEEAVNISASIGISLFPDHGTDLNNLLSYADRAMYKAKEIGKNTFCFYSEDLDTDLTLNANGVINKTSQTG